MPGPVRLSERPTLGSQRFSAMVMSLDPPRRPDGGGETQCSEIRF